MLLTKNQKKSLPKNGKAKAHKSLNWHDLGTTPISHVMFDDRNDAEKNAEARKTNAEAAKMEQSTLWGMLKIGTTAIAIVIVLLLVGFIAGLIIENAYKIVPW